MRTSILAVATVALICGGTSAYTFHEYKRLPSTPIVLPTSPDSLQTENRFDPVTLMGARGYLPDPSVVGFTTVVPDTAGIVEVKGDEQHTRLNTFVTHLRAERFAKGKLQINTAARASVKVNGAERIAKNNADSIPTDASASMTLNPEADYDITIDILSMPDDKANPDFTLRFIPDSEFEDVAIHGGNISKRVEPTTTMLGKRVYRTSLSDDGKYLLTKYSETLSAKETDRTATLTDAATGKVISEDIIADAQWLPSQTALYYMKKRGDAFDVYKLDVPSMRTSVMAHNIPDKDVSFTPDGRYMIYYKNIEAKKQPGPMVRYAKPDDRIPGSLDRSYIMRYDLNSHISTPITFGGASTAIYSISSKGDKLLYGSNEEMPAQYPFYNVTLIEMDLSTLKTDTILNHEPITLNNAIYSPDAKQLFIVAGPNSFDNIGANYGNHEIGNDFDGQGFIMNIADRKVKAMTKDFDPAVESSVVWNEADNKIYFVAEAGFYRYVYSLNPGTGDIKQVTPADLYVKSFSIGEKESQRLSFVGSNFTSDGSAYMCELKSGKTTLIDAPLAETLKDIKFGDMKPWKFTAADGTVVDGYMCLPPDFDANKKYPLIVYYYGGTSPSTATFHHLYSPQVFASRDYVVYVLNPSGTTGYGQEYSARHVNAWGKRTADEIIEGTKLFCKENKFVDDKKIGCIGASYGGFMTQYLQTQTDIFAAAVSHAGISNVTSYWGEGYWGYSYNSVAAAKSYPWSDPELFTKQGSLFNADKIHTPLLLLHGTVDTNVPIGESIQLFNALKILGREVEFITVQDENHVISGYDNKQAWQNTIMAWFAKWLHDDPRWWNELYN